MATEFNPFGQLAEAERYKNDLAFKLASFREMQQQNELANQMNRMKLSQALNPPTELTWKTGADNELLGLPTMVRPGQKVEPVRTGIKGSIDRENTPSAVSEWNFYNSLSPENQQKYLTMKRASKFLDVGGSIVQPSEAQPGKTVSEFPKGLKPSDTPETKFAQEQAKIRAKEQTEAEADLPRLTAQGEEAIGLIDELIKHPGFSVSVGKSSMLRPWAVPGTAAADWKNRYDQLMGKQFLEAFQSLKGGGQITEIEGKKATDAMSRMKTTSSEAEFVKAAREFQGVIKKGIARGAKKAGVETPESTTEPIKVGNFKVTVVK